MRKCPVCRTNFLKSTNLESGLPVSQCKTCQGSWIREIEYSLWLNSQTPGSYDLSITKQASTYFPIAESEIALVCPDCGHFLRRFEIGSSVDFHLDRCRNCNGIWLDHHEWKVLKMGDLHDEIHMMFTKDWQEKISKESLANKLDSQYLEKFGKSDYQKIKDLRDWLQDHPNRNTLLAFLLDDDPYSS